MSTRTIEPTLDFIPADKSLRPPQGVASLLRAFFASIGEGLAAAHHYERLTARGTPPATAVEIVFRDHFAEHR
ncbi:MAG: hypothetical protein KJZ80_00940 [Hyphomicrobiaceae bacterium]|nr:hypothetical protein [Hyphomicrobiaceae bacterium]